MGTGKGDPKVGCGYQRAVEGHLVLMEIISP
jgi:hypothetical protein